MAGRQLVSRYATVPITSSRRDFLKQASLLVAGAAGGGILPWTALKGFAQQEELFPVVETTYGRLRGLNIAGIKTFKGVRYGASTAGRNRFMAPEKPEKWSGVRDALAYGEVSPQNPSDPRSEYVQMIDWDTHPNSGMGEDCLHLNVWTPAVNDGGKRPVFVSFHGGGYSSGSGNAPGFSGDPLARFGDAVVVTVNHRLGALGYLHLGDLGGSKYKHSGVAGVMDLVASLQWVHDNIETFGGDPNRVMIFGQSGGGAKTSAVLGTPSAKGLFQRAAVQSGAALGQRDPEASTRAAERFLGELGISKNNLDEIQNVPWHKILTTRGSGGFSPIVDGEVIPRSSFTPTAPDCSADVPLIVGLTLEDAGAFRGKTDQDDEGLKNWAKDALNENAERVLSAYARVYPNATPFQIQSRILTDRRGRRGAIKMSERKAAYGRAPAYLYVWHWPSPAYNGKFGALHGVDVALVFHNARPIIQGANSEEALKMADLMASVWLAFGRNGDPNCEFIPPWPAYNAETRPTMLFDKECRVENDPVRELRLLWEELSA